MVMIAFDRFDISRLLSGSPIMGVDFVIHFVESPQEAARYAHDVLTEGEKI